MGDKDTQPELFRDDDFVYHIPEQADTAHKKDCFGLVSQIRKPCGGSKKEYERDSIATETSGEGVKNKGVFYNFPSAKKLIEAGEEGLKECKTGFRAPYIMDACRRFDAGELDEKMLRGLDYESVMCELMKVHGIGEKVANCIALFGLSKETLSR